MGISHPPAIFISFLFPFFLPLWLHPSKRPGVTANKPETRTRLSYHLFLQLQSEEKTGIFTEPECKRGVISEAWGRVLHI